MSEASKRASHSRSALRSVAPGDVTASAELWESDPEMLLRLRDAVVAACARPSRDVDMSAVAGLAVLSVARHYRRAASPAHAVALAVMSARTAVVAATMADASETVSVDSDPEVSTRLARWESPTDRTGSVDSLRSRVSDALAALPEVDRETFGRIASAWLAHAPAACDRCAAPGARPSRLTLSSIRAHVAGWLPSDSRSKRSRESDGRTVAAVTDALRPLVESAGYSDGEVWPLAYGWAWHAVNGSGSRRTAGNPDVRTVAEYRLPTVTGSETVTYRDRSMTAPAVIPGERLAATMERIRLATAVAESARVARIRAAQDRDRETVTGTVVTSAAGVSGPDPYGRTVPVTGGRHVRTSGHPLPLWTGGPYPGTTPEPGDPATVGRYAGETVTRETVRTFTTRAAGPAALVTASRLPAGGDVPDVETVTVTRAGETVTRPLSERERSAMVRERETVTIAGETVPVVRETYAGESDGYGERSTAPAPAGDRVGGEHDAPVRAFPTRVSPRKRSGSNTGPTIPVRLR